MRVAVVTSYFPTAPGSYRGHTALQTLQRMKEWSDVSVICPLTIYPLLSGVVGGGSAPDGGYRPAGIDTTYVECPAVPVLSRPWNGRTFERRIRPHLERLRPEVILNYWLYPDGYAAVRAGHALGVPVVVGSIGSDLRRIPDPISGRLIRWTVLSADGMVTVSEELRRRAIEMGAPAEQVTTILNGCDTTVYYPRDRAAARAAVGGDVRDEVVLYVGRLIEAKGLPELVEAFAMLARRRPNARLVVIGEGPAGKSMERSAAAAGIAGRVSLLGRLPSVAEWMRAADVFCLPSHSEGSPNVITEALACGTPVVASDVGGIPELVDSRCGILTPVRQPAALAAGLEEALARQWDRAAIATSFQRSWEDVARETFAVCRAAIERVSESRRTTTG